tara:strand:+ start:2884 stop:3804 length:921 start_codon:yes stop_codon:yes gene_type:complete
MRNLFYGLCVAAGLVLTFSKAIADPQQDMIEQRAGDILVADPKTIMNVRAQIQRNSAARQAPIIDDFADIAGQGLLDLEDMFEVTLQPDSEVPTVAIARYQSTSITFIDAFGNPWPIRRVTNFLDGLVAIERAVDEGEIDLNDPQAGSMTVSALKHGAMGNIVVYLMGLSTPISVKLEGKAGMFHRQATIRVAKAGPQTESSKLLSEPAVQIGAAASADLNNALYGVSPLGAKAMVVEGADGKAWVKGDSIFLQTSLAVFAPQILDVSHGNGLYRAYELPLTTIVQGTDERGQTVMVRIGRAPTVE